MQGDAKAGFSIFWADDGLDTGPILLQRSCDTEPDDTLDSIYNRFLYPEGIRAMVCHFMNLSRATFNPLLLPSLFFNM